MKIILIIIMAIFTYNAKQKKALRIYNNPEITYILCEGGSRSSKTFSISDYIIAKAIMHDNTRQLICRQSKTSCLASVWKQTFMPILEKWDNYPKSMWNEDRSNNIIYFYNGSSVWSGGFDNKQHQDAILGSEWATIYINEILDLGYNKFSDVLTRLQWLDIQLKLFADCNPKAPSHWVNRWFKKLIDPLDGERLPEVIRKRITSIHFHPLDNKENLSPEYLEQLENSKGLARSRFWDGLWAEDLEGLVYTAFERKINVVDEPIKLIPEAETFTTWDFGVSDPTFIIVGQMLQIPKSPDNKEGLIINIIDEYTNKNKEAEHYARWLQKKEYFKFKKRYDYGDPAGQARNAALQSWVSLLWPFGIQIQYTSAYSIDEKIDCANKIMNCIRVCEKQCPKYVEMCENWKYPLDNDGKKKVGSKPEHDTQSHPGTAWYEFTCNRFGTKQGKLIV